MGKWIPNVLLSIWNHTSNNPQGDIIPIYDRWKFLSGHADLSSSSLSDTFDKTVSIFCPAFSHGYIHHSCDTHREFSRHVLNSRCWHLWIDVHYHVIFHFISPEPQNKWDLIISVYQSNNTFPEWSVGGMIRHIELHHLCGLFPGPN